MVAFGDQYIVSPALLQKVQDIVSDYLQGALSMCCCRGGDLAARCLKIRRQGTCLTVSMRLVSNWIWIFPLSLAPYLDYRGPCALVRPASSPSPLVYVAS